jgi:serine/threonine protein kinase
MMNLTLSSHFEQREQGRLLTEGQVGNRADFEAIFEFGDVVGKGQSSIVRVVRRRDTGEIFACKIIDKFAAISSTQRVRDEIKVLMNVRHPNIVSLYAVFETERDLRLIVDYVPGGELFDRIVRKKFYSEREACEVVTSLLSAVAFLHQRNIIHRDIKPENILLASRDNDTDIKLSDFGLAKIFEDPNEDFVMGGGDSFSPPTSPKPRRQRAYTTLGTDYYIAPEVLRGEGYGKQVDMWSVGVVTYILLCGFPPFSDPGGDVAKVYAKIREGHFEFPSPYWDTVSDVAKDLVKRLLTVDPDQRISAQLALTHPWIVRRQLTMEDTPLSPHHASFFRKFNSQRRPGYT